MVSGTIGFQTELQKRWEMMTEIDLPCFPNTSAKLMVFKFIDKNAKDNTTKDSNKNIKYCNKNSKYGKNTEILSKSNKQKHFVSCSNKTCTSQGHNDDVLKICRYTRDIQATLHDFQCDI
eukprot:Pgem_evm1s11967